MALEKPDQTIKRHRTGKTRGPTTFCYKLSYYALPLVCVILIQIVMISEWFPGLETTVPSHMITADTDIRAHTPTLHPKHTGTGDDSDGKTDIDCHNTDQTTDVSEEERIKALLDELEPRRPMTDPGELGAGISINASTLSKDQISRLEKGYRQHGFNEYVSDMISLRRRTPDFRPSVCGGVVYPGDLPQTSVVICFHNEARSTLLRSVYSVLDNTPTHVLHEIILVDDFSDQPSLGFPLEEYVQQLPKVRLIRASKRLGLIGARLLGTASATAPVITFLDSHVECMKGWLQPMLSRIHDNEYRVAYPILHIISYSDFSIKKVPIGNRGLFKWMDLSYFPSRAPDDVMNQRTSDADPIQSPTMPGGIFSISRRYFDLLGQYDPGLKTWGGENTELSFKVWLCNGTIEVTPCSGIGHVFRKVNPNLDGDFYTTVTTNAMRVAYVWMDHYKYFFFNNFIENGQMPRFGDVSERLSLRKRLHCRDFAWYMENIATDLYAPITAQHLQQINSIKFSNICIGHSFHQAEALVGNCQSFRRHQKVWYFEPTGQLLGEVLHGNQTWSCLAVTDHSLTAERCEEGVTGQQWEYTLNQSLRNLQTGTCIAFNTAIGLTMETCDASDNQTWDMLKFPTFV